MKHAVYGTVLIVFKAIAITYCKIPPASKVRLELPAFNL